MKERPILFSGDMVRAILAGRKTMTRRVIKAPICTNKEIYADAGLTWYGSYGLRKPCKFGAVGDRIWVKEKHRFFCHSFEFVGIEYASGGEDKLEHFEDRTLMPPLREIAKNNKDGSRRWKPSIFMRRWASRITLEIVSIRVESLVDISEEDAKAEGIEQDANGLFKCYNPKSGWLAIDDPVESYKTLWDSINGTGSWYDNPYVFVIEFKKVEAGGV